MRKEIVTLVGIVAMLSLMAPVFGQIDVVDTRYPNTDDFFWDKQITDMLMSIFGDPTLLGVFSILTIYLVGLAFRLTLEIQILVMFIFVMIFMSYYISWLPTLGLMAAGLFIGIFLFYAIFNR